MPPPIWWVRATLDGAYGYRIACDISDDDWLKFVEQIAGDDVITMIDAERGVSRGAAFVEGDVVLAWSLDARAVSWDATLELFSLERPDRLAFLSGGGSSASNQSPLVCACFGVREDEIAAHVSRGCRTPAEIGAACKAGTNCGSCVPEIKRLFDCSSDT